MKRNDDTNILDFKKHSLKKRFKQSAQSKQNFRVATSNIYLIPTASRSFSGSIVKRLSERGVCFYQNRSSRISRRVLTGIAVYNNRILEAAERGWD